MTIETMYQMEIDGHRMMFPLFKTVSAFKKVEDAVSRCGIATKMLIVIPENVERHIAYSELGVPIEYESDLRNVVDFDRISGIEIVDLAVNDKIGRTS